MSESNQPKSPFIPEDISEDWIGPPDPVSKIRPVQQFVPANEATLETMFRDKQASVLAWNHQYWKKHNKAFKKERRRFVAEQQQLQAGPPDAASAPVSDDQMAVFYRDFMERNQAKHRRYNWQWYGRNAQLLGLASLVAPLRLLRRLGLLR